MERRIIPLTTELEYAPVRKDHLEEILGGLSCSGVCELPRCYEDRHHLIFGPDLNEAERLLKSHPNFIERVCRDKHERNHKTWDRSEPIDEQTAVDYLRNNPTGMTGKGKQRLIGIEKRLYGR